MFEWNLQFRSNIPLSRVFESEQQLNCRSTGDLKKHRNSMKMKKVLY